MALNDGTVRVPVCVYSISQGGLEHRGSAVSQQSIDCLRGKRGGQRHREEIGEPPPRMVSSSLAPLFAQTGTVFCLFVLPRAAGSRTACHVAAQD